MNKASLSYEKLKKDIEIDIFGIEFSLEINEKYLKEISKLENKFKDEKNDNVVIKQFIDQVLGNGAYEKIKNKYEKDLEKEIDLFVWLKVFGFIGEEIVKYLYNYDENNSNRFNKYDFNKKYNNRNNRRNNRYNNRRY